MDLNELDRIDADVALREGPGVARLDRFGKALKLDQTPYQPTRQGREAILLMDKYIARLVRLPDEWAAIGWDGRAHFGASLMIAVCKVAIASASADTVAAVEARPRPVLSLKRAGKTLPELRPTIA